MSDMATGIPIGLAAGIGAGMGIGLQKARKDLRTYAQQNAITIQDQTGQTISIDQFLNDALGAENLRSKTLLTVLLGIGIALFLIGVIVYAYF